jgi:hypothetical protein
VCRQLGYNKGANSVQGGSPYGRVPDPFSYTRVQCTGQETSLDSCPHSNTDNCGPTEGVGVVCNTAGVKDPTRMIIKVFRYFKIRKLKL